MRTALFIALFAFSTVISACGGASDDKTAKPTKQVAPAAPIPEGYHTITPGIIVDDIDAALAFYEKAFNAQKVMALPGPDGKTMFAEMKLGDSIVQMHLPHGEYMKSPKQLGGTPGSLNYAVENADATFKQAKAAGAKVGMPIDNMFWGDRYGMLIDPFGHHWGVSTAKVKFTPEEIKKGSELAFSKDKKAKKEFQKMWKAAPAADAYKQEGYLDVTPAFYVKAGTGAGMFDFYQKAFGATEKTKMAMPDGSLMHGEVKLGDSSLMFSDEMPAWETKSPATLGGTAMFLYVYVPRVDESLAQAKAAGATIKSPAKDMFWGDRVGTLMDSSGHWWTFASHVKDASEQEMLEGAKKIPGTHD
jgi:uncharacterized glyoxalase superfamily protein PhnB